MTILVSRITFSGHTV